MGDMAAQISQALDNLEVVLSNAELSFPNVARLNYYTTDVSAFLDAAGMLGARLGPLGCQPSSALLGAGSLFHPDLLV
jgi:enamine deaminase RidA (YjgF/YER057c/UK114 family)